MQDYQAAFGGTAIEQFGGIAVRDFTISLGWYMKLFGAEPAFFPNDREAVWLIAEHRWLYIIVDDERAGGTIQTIMCDNLDEVLAGIADRGLVYNDEERPAEGVRKIMYYDPDGNEIGIGQIPSAPK